MKKHSRGLIPRFLVLATYLATVVAWFLAFPLKPPFDAEDILIEGGYLGCAVLAYTLILRLDLGVIKVGWPVFIYGLLIDFLDEFTRESDFFNDAIEDVFTAFGLLLVSIGFYLAYRRRTAALQEMASTSELAERERERLAVTLGSIGDGVIAAGMDGRIQTMNRQAAQITGYPPAAAEGRPLREILPIAPTFTKEPIEDLVHEVLRHPEEYGRECDFMLESASGRKVIELTGRPLRREGADAEGIIFAMRDVTRRREFEKDLLTANKLESVGLRAGGVAHDYNNIMAAIMNWIAFSTTVGQPGPETREAFAEIKKACKRGKQLSVQLMALAKGGEPVKVPSDLGGIVRDAAGFVLHGSSIRAQFAIPSHLWAVEVDPGQFGQVVQNLVLNAKEAMPEGGRLVISLQNTIIRPGSRLPLEPGTYVLMEIQDEGEGIGEEHLGQLFDPYFSTRGRGHGLGLATTYVIIKRHGGHVKVTSERGQGTVFSTFLPSTGKKAIEAPNASPIYPREDQTILLVDDEQAVREPIRAALGQRGFRVIGAASGRDAVDRYCEAMRSGIDVAAVLMDLTMPGELNGREAMKEILELDPRANGIVVSGYHDDPVMADYKRHGFQGFLRKPYDIDSLCQTILATLPDGNGKAGRAAE